VYTDDTLSVQNPIFGLNYDFIIGYCAVKGHYFSANQSTCNRIVMSRAKIPIVWN